MLGPGFELRKANENEIAIIREKIDGLAHAYSGFLISRKIWEGESSQELRYFVVAFPGDGLSILSILDLQNAFDIAPMELEIAWTFGNINTGAPPQSILWNVNRLFHLSQHAGRDASRMFCEPTLQDLHKMAAIHEAMLSCDTSLLDVPKLARQLGFLKGLPYSAPVRFLGYFAILESILTHAPNPNDPYDSITRQVKKKLMLLNRRFQPTLDYAAFGNAGHEKIWKAMYTYRSRIAHGDSVTFKGSELSLLKNHEATLSLLKATVKALLRQALVEPQLLLDLREC
jgi:hypothetical protein